MATAQEVGSIRGVVYDKDFEVPLAGARVQVVETGRRYFEGADKETTWDRWVEIYLAPTADARPGWLATMQHIALEGRCFVLGCNQFIRRTDYPESYRSLLKHSREVLCSGGSVIVSPFGEILAGPLQGEAGILVADLDLDQIVRSKLDFDVNGHYQRKDIFTFEAHGQPPIKKEDPVKKDKKTK